MIDISDLGRNLTSENAEIGRRVAAAELAWGKLALEILRLRSDAHMADIAANAQARRADGHSSVTWEIAWENRQRADQLFRTMFPR